MNKDTLVIPTEDLVGLVEDFKTVARATTNPDYIAMGEDYEKRARLWIEGEPKKKEPGKRDMPGRIKDGRRS